MFDWFSINEQLPEDEENVLAFSGETYAVCKFIKIETMPDYFGDLDMEKVSKLSYFFISQEVFGGILGDVTHWCHLLPPKEHYC